MFARYLSVIALGAVFAFSAVFLAVPAAVLAHESSGKKPSIYNRVDDHEHEHEPSDGAEPQDLKAMEKQIDAYTKQQKAALLGSQGSQGSAPPPTASAIKNPYKQAGAKPLSLPLEEAYAPCAQDDMKEFRKFKEQLDILDVENQTGMTEPEFQKEFGKAMKYFNDPAFMSRYTILSIRCQNGITPVPKATKKTGKSKAAG